MRSLILWTVLGLTAVMAPAQTPVNLGSPGTLDKDKIAIALGYAPAMASAMVGLNTYIPFTEGSGRTAHDMSGHSHDALISAGGTQVWTPQGVQLVSETAKIAGVGGLPTVGICAYFPPGNDTGFSTYQFYSSSNVGGQHGYSFSTTYGPPTGHSFRVYWPANLMSGDDELKDGIVGNHCVEWTIGSTDHIYIDGVEGTYVSQGSSSADLGGGEAGTTVTLSSNNTGSALPTAFYSVWNATTQDTAAQAKARAGSEIQRLRSLGLLFGSPQLSQSISSSCAVQGTSIDVGFEATASPASLLSLDFPCTITNFAISGNDPADMGVAFAEQAQNIYHPRAAKNILYHGGVTNGLAGDGESLVDALGDMISWSRKARLQGWKTIASTMISRSGTGTGGATNDSLAQAFNALLLANGDEFDWVDNIAAVPNLGATSAYSNTTYFNVDGTHPKDAGQAYYVAGMRAGFEGAYGNPFTHVSATYSQVPSDRVLIANSGSGFTVTLIDANYASFNKAGKLCVKNLGAGTVTLATTNSETIDGSATASITTGNNACVVPYVAVAGTGGANWVKVP